jgi:hypothetical protein
MKNVKIENPILESVYKYYTNANNYLTESLYEEGHCITVDDRLFNDLMDMIQTGTYDEIENGHILIPTEGGYTFHITPNSELYLDDERGNELEAQIDPQKLSQLMQAIKTPQYKMVSEGNGNNAFTHVEQDPETRFIKFTKKDNVSPEDAQKAAHTALEKAKARRGDKTSEPSLNDRRNDPEYMEKVHNYWDDRRENMALPHGGSHPRLPGLEESTDEGDVYDPSAVKPDVAQDGLPTGLVNEARISQIVREIIKNKLQ